MHILEAQNLTYRYEDGTTALQNVTVGVEKGTTTAVIGGNGSGKSTLFLNFNGVYRPDSGKVLFCGKPVDYRKKELLELRRRVGIVFQNSDEQLFSASVRKDVCFGLINMGVEPGEAEQRFQEAVEKTGIRDLLEKPTHALSFGQKKRVAIAGIAAMQPDVIILDEPTAGLDPSGIKEVMGLLEDLKQAYGVTVLLSTHEIDLIPLYCSRVIFMDKGNVLFSGACTDLFSKPELLRSHGLRLPRMAHLMEILNEKDGLPVERSAATISGARKNINHLVELYHESNHC